MIRYTSILSLYIYIYIIHIYIYYSYQPAKIGKIDQLSDTTVGEMSHHCSVLKHQMPKIGKHWSQSSQNNMDMMSSIVVCFVTAKEPYKVNDV